MRTATKVTMPSDFASEMEFYVRLAQRGDRAAMEELITRTQDRLYRFCYRLTFAEAQAKDLCQAVYLKALQQLSGLRDPARFQVWLYRIAKNLFLDWVKHRGNNMEELQESAGGAALVNREGMEEIVAVKATLLQLLPEDRVVLLLVDLEGRSLGEAAEIMGKSVHAVESRLRRARERFVEKYERE